MFKKIKNNIFLGIGFSVIVYLILILYFNHTKIFLSLSNYPILFLLISQLLIILSLILKFYRWKYYLNVLRIKIKHKDSLLIFTSGLLMSITPGKVGELLKSFLIKENYDIDISESSPIVLAERTIEFIALIILVILGIILYNFGFEYLIIASIILFVVIFLLINRQFRSKIYSYIQKLNLLKKYTIDLEKFKGALKILFLKIHFFKMILLSLFAWGLECLAFYMLLIGFETHTSIVWTMFIYSFAVFVGSISMLPGGIGTTEGLLIFILTQNKFLESDAFIATILIRIVTLWVPVVIGFISLIFYIKKMKSSAD